jgi:hypothetical protein
MANGRKMLKEREWLSRIDRSCHAPCFLSVGYTELLKSQKNTQTKFQTFRSLKFCDCKLECPLFYGDISKFKIQIFPGLTPGDRTDRLSQHFHKKSPLLSA